MELEEVGRLANRVLDEVEKAVVGKREALELLLLGVLADGHVLIEDYPGPRQDADGALVRAHDRRLDFSRIQFTPDLMPSDVTGSSIYNQREADFEFRPGPIFANLLLADEINRAPPKTQAALLEAMQERQVTLRGRRRARSAAVPRARDAEPDRVRGHLPAARGAARPLPAAHVGRLPVARRRVADARQPCRARPGRGRARAGRSTRRRCSRDAGGARGGATSSEPVGLYMVDIAAATRAAQSVQVGASPRGSLALLKLVALPGRARRPRLRDARRRQGDRRARARAPADAPTRAVGAAGVGRGRRPRAPRRRCRRRPPTTSNRRRVTRSASPKLAAYAALSALGLLAALVSGRPELVALTAPFLLALGVGLALATPPRLDGRASSSSDRSGARGRRGAARARARRPRRRSTASTSTSASRPASSSPRGAQPRRAQPARRRAARRSSCACVRTARAGT